MVDEEMIAKWDEARATLKHQGLQFGKSYMIKSDIRKRRTRAIFHRLRVVGSDETPVYEFAIGSSVVFLTDEMLHEIEEVIPNKVKNKKERICPKCLGMKRFEHLKHIDSGICYKCGGTGLLN